MQGTESTEALLKEMHTMLRRASEHASLREHEEPGSREYERLSSEIHKELTLVRMAAGLALDLEEEA